MDYKKLIPFVLGAAGAGASYYFLGRRSATPKGSMEPLAWAVGGGLVGFVAGQFLQSRLQQPTLNALPPPAAAPQPIGEYLDLDTPPRRALPPPKPPTRPKAESSVRAAEANDASLLESMGSFEGSGEDGLGSYETGLDVDNIDMDELLRESGYKN